MRQTGSVEQHRGRIVATCVGFFALASALVGARSVAAQSAAPDASTESAGATPGAALDPENAARAAEPVDVPLVDDTEDEGDGLWDAERAVVARGASSDADDSERDPMVRPIRQRMPGTPRGESTELYGEMSRWLLGRRIFGGSLRALSPAPGASGRPGLGFGLRTGFSFDLDSRWAFFHGIGFAWVPQNSRARLYRTLTLSDDSIEIAFARRALVPYAIVGNRVTRWLEPATVTTNRSVVGIEPYVGIGIRPIRGWWFGAAQLGIRRPGIAAESALNAELRWGLRFVR